MIRCSETLLLLCRSQSTLRLRHSDGPLLDDRGCHQEGEQGTHHDPQNLGLSGSRVSEEMLAPKVWYLEDFD